MRNSSLHDLRDMLSEELDKFAKKGELDRSSLDMVDKLNQMGVELISIKEFP